MYATKTMEIETMEVVSIIYDDYEEYEEHCYKLYEKGYEETFYCHLGTKDKVLARYERKVRKEMIPRIHIKKV